MNRRLSTNCRLRFGSKAIWFAGASAVFVLLTPSVRAGDNSAQPKDWFKAGVAWLYLNCGNTYDNIVRHDKAVRAYDEALKVVPDDLKALDCRGYSLVKVGLVGEALKDLNRVIELKPTYADAYFHRSEAYSQAKKFDLAKTDLAVAIRLGGKKVDIIHAQDFMRIKQKEPQ